jgi:hypothetical protein
MKSKRLFLTMWKKKKKKERKPHIVAKPTLSISCASELLPTITMSAVYIFVILKFEFNFILCKDLKLLL